MLATNETKELKIMSDISNLSLKELKELYLKDQETYEKFLEEYFNCFGRRLNYQLRISDQYEKIYELCKTGLEMYPTEKSIDTTAKLVDIMAYVEGKYAVKPGYDTQDREQAIALFLESIGAARINAKCEYGDAIKGIYESSLDYDNRGEFTIDDFASYVSYVLKSYSEPMEVQMAIDKYKEDHPLSKRCNDIRYLYFVNYMVSRRKKTVDDEFIKNAKGIIEMSKIVNVIDKFKRFNKDYAKLSQYTLKNIKKYEKLVARENDKEKAEQKRIVKKMFPKKHIQVR